MKTQKPKLLDELRQTIRVKNYSYRTKQSYTYWVKQYIFFHDKRHPQDMGVPEIEAFLRHLAVDRHVAPSTQNQTLSALLLRLHFWISSHSSHELTNKTSTF